MTAKELFEYLEKCGVKNTGKLHFVRFSLVRNKLMTNYKKPVTAAHIAWALYTLSSCEVGTFDNIVAWVAKEKAFAKKARGITTIEALKMILDNIELANEIDSINIEKYTGIAFANMKDNTSRRLTMRVREKIDFSNRLDVIEYTSFSGKLISELAEFALEAKKQLA
jgi:hypothetical protein